MRRPVEDKAMPGTRSLRCPACGRWLGEVSDYARLVCQGCSAEVTYKSAAERRAQERA